VRLMVDAIRRVCIYTFKKYTCTRYGPIVKLPQRVHVYTYVELVAVFTTIRMRRACSPAALNGYCSVEVAKPVSASQRALSFTWRLPYFLVLAKA
jgi:hypothetical protein